MKRDPVVELLRAIPGMGSASERTLHDLAPLVDHVRVEKGACLTKEGRSGREAFVIVGGQGSVMINGKSVAEVGIGEFVGEMALLDGGPRTATVRANSPMDVLVIGPQAFGAFINHPGVAKALAAQLAHKLRVANESFR